jgi:hypothetical protein
MSYVASTRSTRYGTEPARGRTLIHWGSVFAGAVWALAITVLLSALWLALAYGSEVHSIRANIEWFLAGSAMFALLVGGFVAIPSVIGGAAAFGGNILGSVANAGGTTKGIAATQAADTSLWAGFWTALVGFVLAALGGALGGATPRDDSMYETFDRDETHDERRMEVVDDDRNLPSTGTDRY